MIMFNLSASLSIAGVALVALAACSNPRGRLMSDSDQDLVGERAAGAAAYDRLISDSVGKMLSDFNAARTAERPFKVVCLAVENRSAEELGDWQEQLYSLITTSVSTADRFDLVSRRFVEAALRETRLRPSDLFIPSKRRQFIAVLEAQGEPVDAIVFPNLTSGTTEGEGKVRQRNYLLELEMVDVTNGSQRSYTARLRKEYQG